MNIKVTKDGATAEQKAELICCGALREIPETAASNGDRKCFTRTMAALFFLRELGDRDRTE